MIIVQQNRLAGRFKLANWLQKSGTAVYKTLKRFPLTVIFLVALACLFIYRNEASYEKLQLIEATLNRVMGTLVLGVALSLFATMLQERISKKLNLWEAILAYVLQLALLFLFYQFVFMSTEMVPNVTLVFSTAALLLGFIFLPYLFNNQSFEIYVIKLITKAAVSAFFTLSLSLGLVAVLASIKALLIADLNSNLYLYTFVIGWLVFAPVHFLSDLPDQPARYRLRDYSWVLKIAFTYIALPILSIYTVILYLYFGKVLITQNWPTGVVSYLVVAYSAVGIATIFFLWPYKTRNKWVNIFIETYTKAIFPLLIMMFIAIGLRINQYGFTENRYFILIIGIWTTLVMIFININKGRNNIVFLTSLALALLISVYGPANAFNISKHSQNNRLNSILNTYNMIEDGQVINRNAQITELDKREIANILTYFQMNHSFSDVSVLPPDYSAREMKEYFGFENYYDIPVKDNAYFYYNRGDQPISVAGYEIMYEFFASPKNSDHFTSEAFIRGNDEYRLNIEGSMLTVYKNDESVYVFDMVEHAANLYQKHGHSNNFSVEDLSFTDESQIIEVKFLYNQVNGYVGSSTQEVALTSAQGKLLVKIKGE